MKTKNFRKKFLFIALIFLAIVFMAAPVFAELPEIPENTVWHDGPNDNITVYIFAITSLVSYITFLILVLISFIKTKRSKETQNVKNKNKEKEETNQIKKKINLNLVKTIFFAIWLLLTWIFILYAFDHSSSFSGEALEAASLGYWAIIIVSIVWIIKLIATKKVTKTDIGSLISIALALLIIPPEAHEYCIKNFLLFLYLKEVVIDYIIWLSIGFFNLV